MKKRILIVGKRGGILQWYEHLLAAQEQLTDTELEGFALNHNNFYERAKKTISGVFNKSNKDIISAKALEKSLIHFNPNLIVIADLFYLSDNVINVLKKHKKNYKITHWIGDFFDERLLRTRDLIDNFYFTDSGLLQSAKELGLDNSSYLPLAFNPKLFKRPETEKRINDLLFIGAWSENRETIIREIKIPMTVIGKGWRRIEDTLHNVIGKNVSNQEVARLYQQHACVLNIINSGNISNGLNMRCFEAPACGALLLTDNVVDLSLNYTDGKDVLSYSTPSSLSKLYEELLKKPEHLKNVADSGYNQATNKHSYSSRLKNIIQNLV